MSVRICKSKHPDLSIIAMCRVFGKTRPALYKREKYIEKSKVQDEAVIEKITRIRNQLPMTGGRKLKYMLSHRQIKIGRDKLFKLLRTHNLLVRRRRKYARTTQSDHWYRKHKNIYKNINVTMPEQVFVSDITYIRIPNGFCYLSLVTDAYSKRIMGYKLHGDLSREGTIAALKDAIEQRHYTHDLLHHSDRGLQYCCHDYVNKLSDNNILVSMTESGSPYDNAIAERVNGILKTELGLDKEFKNYGEALGQVKRAVYLYNKKRPHLSCGYLTPDQAHKKTTPLAKAWKKYPYKVRRLKSYSDEAAGPLEANADEIGNNFCAISPLLQKTLN
jgi:transposase InsO family protein